MLCCQPDRLLLPVAVSGVSESKASVCAVDINEINRQAKYLHPSTYVSGNLSMYTDIRTLRSLMLAARQIEMD